MKWKPLELADLLRSLQPVESSWETLARYLLDDELKYKIATIKSDGFHDSTSKALDDVLDKWQNCTPRSKRIWQTLCNAAKKYGDQSLDQYIVTNLLESEFL